MAFLDFELEYEEVVLRQHEKASIGDYMILIAKP